MVQKRRAVEGGWIVASILYGGLRSALVWAFLRQYGVNVLGFVAIEVVSSAVYGLSSARVVGAAVDADWGRFRSWIPLAIVSYFAPDAYVFASAGRMPDNILTVLVGVVLVTVTLSTVAFVARVRAARRESSLPVSR